MSHLEIALTSDPSRAALEQVLVSCTHSYNGIDKAVATAMATTLSVASHMAWAMATAVATKGVFPRTSGLLTIPLRITNNWAL